MSPHTDKWLQFIDERSQINLRGINKNKSMLCLVTQLHLTLCHPMNCNPPGSSVHGILQARMLEWVATPSCRGSSQPKD